MHAFDSWVFIAVISAGFMVLVLSNCGCFEGHVKLRWHPVPCICTRHGTQLVESVLTRDSGTNLFGRVLVFPHAALALADVSSQAAFACSAVDLHTFRLVILRVRIRSPALHQRYRPADRL